MRWMLMLLVLVSTSWAQEGKPEATTPPAAAAIQAARASDTDNAAPVVRIAPGDLLEISIYGAPDLGRTDRVSSEGTVALPLIGQTRVGGMTAEQASNDLRKRFLDGGYLRDPQVSVFIKEYSTQGVSVLGEVNKPGVYPVLGSRRLLDVVSAAGGTTTKAGRRITITHRDHPNEAINVNLGDTAQSSMSNNVEVSPGDTVVVEKAGVVYVVGDVGKPGGFTMENNERLSVLQALALAQGINKTAALGRAKLIRRTPEGQKEQPLDLKRILSAKASDMQLQADDIVFVPNSAAKSATSRSLEAILQTATGVVIYRRP